MSKFILSFFILLFSVSLYSQCGPDTLTVSNDTTLCTGQSILLSPGPGYFNYSWSTGSTSSYIVVSQPGVYICNAKVLNPNNLVVNGNFSSGNTGFTSNYIYGTGGSYGLLSNEGQYAISTNASLTHTNFAACTDHTGNNGNFMIVNGSSTANTNVWCQTVSVNPATSYIFRAWFTSVHTSNPAILNFSINGSSIGPNANVSSATCYWQSFFQTWTSGATQTSANICITNQNINPSGNDFAIDDIYFAQICQYHDTVNVYYNTYPNPQLGNDTILCQGDSLILNATCDSISTYLWNTGSTDSIITAYTTGTYSVTVSNGVCFKKDSLHLDVYPYPNINLGNDTAICGSQTLTLNSGATQGLISWSHPGGGVTLTVADSGLYWVSVNDHGCISTDSIHVGLNQGNSANLDSTYKFCQGDTLILDPGSGASYLWTNGSQDSALVITNPGVQYFGVNIWDSNGCQDSASTMVFGISLPQTEITASDDTICLGTNLTLEASGGQSYIWQDGSLGNVFTTMPTTTTTYSVIGTNSYDGLDCSIEESILIVAKNCHDLEIPNVITPNGDGRNDIFKYGYQDEWICETIIYNRWGKKVFHDENSKNWDGRENGNLVSQGVYYYVIKAKAITSGEIKEYHGTVTVLYR